MNAATPGLVFRGIASPLRALASAVYWLGVALGCLVLFPVALCIWAVSRPFDRRLVVLHRFTCFWASLYTWLNPAWRVEIEGREKILPDRVYVMVANHQSSLDILVLFRLFTHFKWVSKDSMFRVPCVGWNMTLNRYIRIRRGDRRSVAQMMRDCERTLEEGSSLMMFPEGTRSADGSLRPFRQGAFTLAKRRRLPLLPILVDGTAQALPKKSFVFRGRHTLRVRVLDEIPASTFEDTSSKALAEEVHGRLASELGDLRDEERRRQRAESGPA